jgi:hypothetical protein
MTELRDYQVEAVEKARVACRMLSFPQLRLSLVGYFVGHAMNGELYLAMLPQWNSGTAELLDNKVIRAQALSLERHTARGHQCRCVVIGPVDRPLREGRLTAASVSVPDSSKTPWARETRSRPSDQNSAPSVRRTGSHAFWLMMVPNPPGEAPTSATGWPPKTRWMSAGGLDSQSIAFLNTPHSRAVGCHRRLQGRRRYSGMPRMVLICSCVPSGIKGAAARSSTVL